MKEKSIIGWILVFDIVIRCCAIRLYQPKDVTYVENPWSGGGNAGPAVEVIAGGPELATSCSSES